ncbi:PorP/SprF family type IX secretion system membrane protein [Paracrocinitomix mangrovi]|uniref:PorP/SprF family type IX secretion system membrane protein n=1 Tax=Paracrocinitomix mangrovi TaxID=2862509 RepID=UPI001C8E13CA|nr:PorP/SprF family type IX secretion system membrane protein [Paracrocinitomix mangrovi]UKN00855.1 PorP/SprF family type IX secretion system membrane protein [Paracrocinitomix mangrovi]
MKRKILYIVLLCLPLYSNGQDIHFSQTTRSFYQINPGFLGAFNGNLRAELNWKDQWQSINNTFRTYGASLQFSFGKGDPRFPVFFALGAQAFKDVAGDVEIGNTTGGLSFASFLKLNRNSRLSLGIQGNYGVTGLDPSKMQWGSQYNGLNFDPTLTNGSGIEFQGFSYADFSAGVGYWYTKNDRNVIAKAPQDAKVGLAVFHINKPRYSYEMSDTTRLRMRFVLHGSAIFATGNEDLYWYPNANIMIQGRQHEVLLGSLWKYRFRSGSKVTGFNNELSITGGVDIRVTNVLDAVVPQVYIGIHHFSVGMSYDVNVSRLNQASKFRGGFELSLRFTNPDAYIHRNPWRRGISI